MSQEDSPVLMKAALNRAAVEARRRSQARASPPPVAEPLMAAMTRLSHSWMASTSQSRYYWYLYMYSCWLIPSVPGTEPTWPLWSSSLSLRRSAPAQNPRPLPVRMTTRTLRSRLSPQNSSVSSPIIVSLSALSRPGRFMRTSRMPSSNTCRSAVSMAWISSVGPPGDPFDTGGERSWFSFLPIVMCRRSRREPDLRRERPAARATGRMQPCTTLIFRARWPWSPAGAAAWDEPWPWAWPMPGPTSSLPAAAWIAAGRGLQRWSNGGDGPRPWRPHWASPTGWQQWGRVDLLINNAGINPTAGALTELTPALFQKLFDVNTLGPWYLASRLAPRMGEAGGGVIINVLSVAAIRPPAGQGFYAATKAALKALTAVMAAEWAPLKVRVNALAPGSYHSDLFDQAAAAIPGFLEGARQASLQQRIAATEEIVGPILYLASEMSAYTTVATLISDGGLTAL